MGSNKEKIGQSVALSYGSIVFAVITGLLYTPWLIRELGKSDYAIYTICISLMAYFTMDFGIGASITRFIARYRAEKAEHKVNGLLGIALKVYLTIDMIALILLLIMYFLLGKVYVGLTPTELSRLKVVYIITGMMIVCCIPVMPLNGVFIAYGRVYDVKKFDLIQKALTVGLICISLICGRGLYAVVLINAVTTVAINAIKLMLIYRKEQVVPDVRSKDRTVMKELLTFSGWVAIAMIADKFFFSFEPTLLGIFSNSTQISVFAVATSIEGYVLLFADGLNGIFLPRVTNMVVQKKSRDDITSLMIRVGRLQMLIVSVFIMGIVTQGKDFISLWFGKEYTASYYAAVVVLIPCFVHLTQSIATETLFATNNVRYRALAYVASSLVNILLTALLAPRLGAMGAAIGIACGFVVGHEVILNIVYTKVLKLDLKRFFSMCHLKAVPFVLAMLALGYAVARFWPVASKLQVLLRCGVCGMLFLVVAYLLYLTPEEKAYFYGILGKIKSKVTRK